MYSIALAAVMTLIVGLYIRNCYLQVKSDRLHRKRIEELEKKLITLRSPEFGLEDVSTVSNHQEPYEVRVKFRTLSEMLDFHAWLTRQSFEARHYFKD